MMERRQRIETLFHEALERPEAEREAFLRQSCEGDSGLFREVRSLVANHHEADDLRPWAAAAAARLIAGTEALEPGQSLGPYQIVSFLASGGMGSVYRARDPRMGRDVAIKVAAERFSERFSREVRAVASLNHPNICQVYDVGPNYLVMELVEGESPQGPLPLEEALRIARQIAGALEEAHEKGIVHRDLKPGNIKIKPDGTVKVLDFGLAKATITSAAYDSHDSPTISMAGTQAGIILGTAAYVSPEQARGKPVDRRTDIWAFGVVLYELLTGQRLFRGEDLTETLASVVKDEPRLDQAPPQVRRLLRRCLEKDPKQRLRDIGDVWELLETPAETRRLGSRQGVAGWIAAGVLAALAAVATWAPWRKPPAAAEVRRYQIPIKASATAIPFAQFSISPDGRNLAYVTRDGNITRVWIHSLDSLEARSAAAVESAQAMGGPAFPFWSPDSRNVAFVAGTKLRKISISGGSVQTICDVSRRLDTAGSWNRNGVILIGQNGEILSVSDGGGIPSPVVAAHGSDDRLGFFPNFLPDGRHFLYYGGRTEAGGGAIYIGSLDLKPDAQTNNPLLRTDAAAIFAADPAQPDESGLGHIIFQRDGTLFARPFNARRLEFTGEAIPVADPVGRFFNLPSYSASANGVLIHHPGVTWEGGGQLAWFDRQGHAAGTLAGPSTAFRSEGAYRPFTSLSPDGTQAAVSITDYAKSTQDIWVFDTRSHGRTRFTFDSQSQSPLWSPDGRRMVFAHDGKLFAKNADGTGEEEPLAAVGQEPVPTSWSRDGRYLLYTAGRPGHAAIWVLPLEGGHNPFPFSTTAADQGNAVFSPDGKWVAYSSDETGAVEIYVRPFPPSKPGRWLVSNGVLRTGAPSWRQDGRELFYTAPDHSIMAVSVAADSVFQHGEPKALFTVPDGLLSNVTPDGNRFLLYVRDNEPRASSQPFTVVLNWQAGLKK